MKKFAKTVIAAAVLAVALPSIAEEEEEGPIGWTPFAISLASPVQLPWGIGDWDVFGIDLGLFYNDVWHMYGLDLALATTVRGDTRGVVASGVFNYASQDVYAIRLTLGANICRMTHITDGSTIGYRYFNFDRLAGTGKVALSVTLKTYGVAASVDVWLKRPDAETGGLKVGTFALPCCRKLDEFHEETVFLDVPSDCRGKQAVYFTFSSPVKQTPLCEIESFVFRRLPEIAFHGVSDFRDEVPARRGGFKAPPVGWMTWYALWFGTTEEKVLRNARDFMSAFGDVLVEKPVLWIDWEWFHPQLWPGGSIEGEDSLTPRTKLYPRGLKPVAQDLKSMGFVPGLWVSVVSDVKTNALWAAHPEWLLPPSNEWCGPVWGDPTAPGFCEEYVPEIFGTYRSWGYEAFKWDTIPHAITVFDRSKGSMDDMFCQSRAAVRRMVEAGRKAVGDAYLLSCSGETDAAVEACPDLFSAARVGADVSKWDEFVKEGVDRFLKYADLHAKTLWCDMDNLVLRAEYSNLAQARTRVSLYSLFGVPLTLGDEISALDRPRIDMLRKVLSTFNVRPVSVGRRVPGEVFRSQVDFIRPDSRWTLHAFTNFETDRTLKTVFPQTMAAAASFDVELYGSTSPTSTASPCSAGRTLSALSRFLWPDLHFSTGINNSQTPPCATEQKYSIIAASTTKELKHYGRKA